MSTETIFVRNPRNFILRYLGSLIISAFVLGFAYFCINLLMGMTVVLKDYYDYSTDWMFPLNINVNVLGVPLPVLTIICYLIPFVLLFWYLSLPNTFALQMKSGILIRIKKRGAFKIEDQYNTHDYEQVIYEKKSRMIYGMVNGRPAARRVITFHVSLVEKNTKQSQQVYVSGSAREAEKIADVVSNSSGLPLVKVGV